MRLHGVHGAKKGKPQALVEVSARHSIEARLCPAENSCVRSTRVVQVAPELLQSEPCPEQPPDHIRGQSTGQLPPSDLVQGSSVVA